MPQTPHAAQEQAAELDRTALDAIRDLDAGGAANLLAQVVALYLGDAPALIARIRDGLQRGDADGVRTAAHTLRSSSANLGARQLARMCAALEAAARSGQLAAGLPTAEEVEQEFQAVFRALERETGKPSA